MINLRVQLLFTLVGLAVSDSGPQWNYEDPQSWHGVCPTGKAQSPIRLHRHYPTVKKIEDFKRFSFVNYDLPSSKMMHLVNNGHTVKFEMRGDIKYHIKNGGLPGSEFELVQGHFHWGMTNNQGSEHLIDGVHYPMELHLVHYNKDVGNTFEAASSKRAFNSLAVLGVMFEIQDNDNPKLNKLTDAMVYLQQEKSEYKMKSIPLTDLLPRNTDMFYRYNGSLTTPACLEIVVWTVFKQSVPISLRQLEKFRMLKQWGGNKPVGDNFRPTQEINERAILDVDTSRKFFSDSVDVCGSTASAHSNLSLIAFIFTVFLCYFYSK